MTQTAYHYTSLSTAMEILKNRTIHLTNIRCCNDGSEYVYGIRLFREVWNNRMGGAPFPELESQFAPYWIACFTNELDVVSQWTQYGDGGYGVCLEFNLEEVRKTIDQKFPVELVDVNYNPALQKEILSEHARVLEQGDWSTQIFSDICKMKQPAFRSESEIRLLVFQNLYSRDVLLPERRVHYRSSKGTIVPYLKSPQFAPECITNVVLGPMSKSVGNRLHLKMFLEDNGFSCSVSESNVHLR